MSALRITGLSTVTPASVMSVPAMVCPDIRHRQVRSVTVAPVDELA